MKTNTHKPLLIVGLCLFGNLFARRASADPSVGDKSIAAQLFEEGRALLAQGRLDEACPKLEESEHLDPGGGTLLNVALCHERQGRTATAWVEFVEARGVAKADGRQARVAFAQAHIDQLEPGLSRVVVQVASGSDLPDLEIKRDGSVVARVAWGSAVPVDPGDHVVEASAPGKVPWKQTIGVGAGGDMRTVIVPVLQSAAVASAMTPIDVPAAAARPIVEDLPLTPGADSASPPSGIRGGARGLAIGGWASLVVGLGGAAASTYFALHALALKNDADRGCPQNACTAQGASENRDAIRSADLATAFAAVGVAGLGAGTVLLVMSGAHQESRPVTRSVSGPALVGFDVSWGPDRGEMVLRGRW